MSLSDPAAQANATQGSMPPVRTCAPLHLRAALNGSQSGLITYNDALEVLFLNERLPAILGIRASVAACATSLLDLLEASEALDCAAVQRTHEICLAAISDVGDSDVGDSRSTIVSQTNARCFGLSVTALKDGNWAVFIEESTAKRAAEADAVEQAMCDPLTGLPNRQRLQTRLTGLLSGAVQKNPAEAGPVVMLLDLDRFKAVNDTLGHPIGDGLLRLVSKRLRSVARTDDLICRFGGDEFALLAARSLDAGQVATLARRIIDVVGRPYLIDGHLVNIGVSIGVALAPQDGCEYKQLLRSADLALYHAKSSGRGTFSFFEPGMDARALARRALEIDLRKALALREFELHYQPQIDLKQDVVVGFEALLRWRHPERGLVPPGDFIRVTEEIGLIIPLGEWVMREACMEAARWPSDVSVAVNVSPHQFEDTARLVSCVARALSASGLPGHRLEIEITESVLLRNEQAVLEALHQLRAMRVRVAMDDFGTGYSSLSQLHSFPFDKIKIDRSFVKNARDVSSQNAIIRAITALGASLGMSTIAEGVETMEQLARIRSEGCTSVQGYLFSRAVPVEQIDALLAEFAQPSSALS